MNPVIYETTPFFIWIFSSLVQIPISSKRKNVSSAKDHITTSIEQILTNMSKYKIEFTALRIKNLNLINMVCYYDSHLQLQTR